MRLFIAIGFTEEIKNAIKNVMDAMRAQGVHADFTAVENLHLTLAFIGETPSGRIALIREAMENVPPPKIDITLNGIGNFGDLLWVGLKENRNLSAYVKELRSSLRSMGIAFDGKPFKPHVTVARRAKPNADFTVSVAETSMQAANVSLMKSERVGGKMRYTELFSIPFTPLSSF